MTEKNNIIIKDLSVMRGLREVIKSFDLSVEAGQAVVIRGANGSGKTTLLRAMAGLMPIASGSLSIDGISYDDDRAAIHQDMIYIGHRDGFSGYLTAGENLKLWADTKGYQSAEMNKKISDALKALSMGGFADTPLYMMSEGQRKRCGLARLVLSQSFETGARIWLLDEPLTALDHDTAQAFAAVINQHTEAGGIAVLSTHQDIKLKRVTIISLDESKSKGGLS